VENRNPYIYIIILLYLVRVVINKKMVFLNRMHEGIENEIERWIGKILANGITPKDVNEFYAFVDDCQITEIIKSVMELFVEGEDERKAKSLGWIE